MIIMAASSGAQASPDPHIIPREFDQTMSEFDFLPVTNFGSD